VTHHCIGDPVTKTSPPSWSYREYDVQPETPEAAAWEKWFTAHHIPLAQIPYQGWAARDVVRRTVSVKVMAWNPGDESKELFGQRTFTYVDKNDDGDDYGAKDVRYGVYTVQLDSMPLPFPEVD
jgi:hypothetical protein